MKRDTLADKWERFLNSKDYDLPRRILFTVAIVAFSRVLHLMPLGGVDEQLVAPLLPMISTFTAVLGPTHAAPEMNLLLLGFAPMFFAGGSVQLLSSELFRHPLFKDPEAGFPISLVADLQYLKEANNFDEIESINIRWTAFLCVIMGMILAWQMRACFTLATVLPAWVHVGITLAAGGMLIKWTADRITIAGIGQGMSVMLSLAILNDFMSAIQSIITSYTGGAITTMQMGLFLGFFVVMTAGAIVLQNGRSLVSLTPYDKTSPYNFEHLKPVLSNNAPFLINPSGMTPVLFTIYFIQMVQTLAVALAPVSTAVAACLTSPVAFYGLHFTMTFAINMLDFNNTPSRTEKFMTGMRCRVPGWRPGDTTKRLLLVVQGEARWLGGLMLATLVTAAAALDMYMVQQIGVKIGYASLMIVVGTILQAKRQVESIQQMPKLRKKIEAEI